MYDKSHNTLMLCNKKSRGCQSPPLWKTMGNLPVFSQARSHAYPRVMRYISHAFLGTPTYDLACTVTPCPNAIPMASCESCTYTNSFQQHSHMNLFQQNYWKLSTSRYWRVMKQCSWYDDYIWIIGHLQLIILDSHLYIRICCPHKIRSTQHRFPSMGTF